MLNKHSDGKLASFQEKIEGITKNSKGSNKAELQKWKQNSIIKDANLALKKVLYVRTILSTRDELNLLDFYYPSTFVYETNRLSIEELMKDESTQPSLIIGTVGQGKSIALRYIAFYSLCKSHSIPVFLELRKLRSSTSLFEHIRQSLKKIKLQCSEKLLKYFLNNGLVTVFLDGFDEIKHEKRDYWINEIEDFVTKYSQCKVFVTTRPDTDIHHSHTFKKYELSPLDENDRPGFIKKLVKKEDDQKALIVKLATASKGVNDLLRTPLLMALFISVYQNRRKLPNSNSEFFDELFSTILSRHDGLKAAYDRPTKCGFTDKELKTSLQALAYQTRKANLRQLQKSKLNEICILALNSIGFDSSKFEDFIYDVNNITCILQKDGLEYRFIHDSVQEFYSASFVRDQEESKEEFYTKYFNDWHQWSPELNFLKYIDELAYKKYFLIPSFKGIGQIDESGCFKSIKKEVYIDILKATDIIFFKINDEEYLKKNFKFLGFSTQEKLNSWAADLYCRFSMTEEDNNAFHKAMEKEFSSYFNSDFNSLGDIIINNDSSPLKEGKFLFYIFNAYDSLRKYRLIEKMYKSLNEDSVYELDREYKAAVLFIEKKKKIGGVF